MAKNMKKTKVISKNTKGIKKTGKENVFKKIIGKIKSHKILTISICSIIVALLIVLFLIFGLNKDEEVISINNKTYTESDFMIYVYSAKYNYFNGKTDVSDKELNVIYDDESKTTVRDYVKEVALNDIKTVEAISSLADKYNVSLDSKDQKKLSQEKSKFIKEIGGKNKYNKFLKDNKTTNKAYDKMSKSDYLYKKLIKEIYGEGKINDLTELEKTAGKESYKDNYIKIKQIILPIIDVTTGKSLTSTTINQKEALANKILDLYKSGTDFDTLIKNYSEDAVDKEPPYDTYYKKGELLEDLEEKILFLNPNQVSDVIRTEYAFHIVLRLDLDDAKLNDYLDLLRETKCMNDLKKYLDKQKIIYYKAYDSMKLD